MEKENKGKKVLEIILIVLVALSFVLIPLLNQYRQKTISLNHTQLVNRQNSRNGTIDIDTYNDGNIKTISSGTINIYDYNYIYSQADIDGGISLTGVNDVMGYGFDNYFRFIRMTDYNTPNTTKIYALEYYLVFKSNETKSYKLGYFDINEDNDEVGNFLSYRPISKAEFNLGGILPDYNVLNFSFYNDTSFNNLMSEYLSKEVFMDLVNIDTNYKYASAFENFIFTSKLKFINFNQDNISNLVSTARDQSYRDGYNDGYNVGFNDGTSNESVFSMLKHAANALQDFLNIEVLPNISLWLLISIPLSISIMLIMFKLLRGDH